MNVWNGMGNITKDPEVRYSTGENRTAVLRMNVAINEGYGENQKTHFIPVVAFGRLAENCEKYLAKGSKIAVTGKIATSVYEKNNVSYHNTEVIASNIEFIGGRNER